MKRLFTHPLVLVAFVVGAGALSSACTNSSGKLPLVVVYKSPTCGCCSKWVDHLSEAGFQVKVNEIQDMAPMKVRYGVPTALQSCHTAQVGGYVLEGHVPASDVKRLLTDRPDVVGLAVAGMPMGSPGMDGGTPVPYDVVAFHEDGRQETYSSHTGDLFSR